jgi:hypothetical protein
MLISGNKTLTRIPALLEIVFMTLITPLSFISPITQINNLYQRPWAFGNIDVTAFMSYNVGSIVSIIGAILFNICMILYLLRGVQVPEIPKEEAEPVPENQKPLYQEPVAPVKPVPVAAPVAPVRPAAPKAQMFCPYCGAKRIQGNLYCGKCGEKYL